MNRNPEMMWCGLKGDTPWQYVGKEDGNFGVADEAAFFVAQRRKGWQQALSVAGQKLRFGLLLWGQEWCQDAWQQMFWNDSRKGKLTAVLSFPLEKTAIICWKLIAGFGKWGAKTDSRFKKLLSAPYMIYKNLLSVSMPLLSAAYRGIRGCSPNKMGFCTAKSVSCSRGLASQSGRAIENRQAVPKIPLLSKSSVCHL